MAQCVSSREAKSYKMSDYICEELIFEILTRVPPKSLIRFRSVSKSWYSCIGSPGFIRMHTFQSPQKVLIKHHQSGIEGFYTLHSEDEIRNGPGSGYIGITPFEFPCDRYFKNIIGSCNGIFCLSDDKREHFSLWNPSIRRKLIVPDCPWRFRFGVAIGFGFDRITDDYKIVIIPKTRNGGTRNSSFVYAMKTAAWCVIASPMPLIFIGNSEAYFVNGVLYWVVGSQRPCILAFDLNTHVFGMIALPKLVLETIGLTTIQGSLATISYCKEHVKSWIWVRRDASWSLVFKSKTNNNRELILRVLQLSNDGDLLLNTTHDDRLQIYNPERGARSTLVRLNLLDDIVLCAESLQLLDIGTAC